MFEIKCCCEKIKIEKIISPVLTVFNVCLILSSIAGVLVLVLLKYKELVSEEFNAINIALKRIVEVLLDSKEQSDNDFYETEIIKVTFLPFVISQKYYFFILIFFYEIVVDCQLYLVQFTSCLHFDGHSRHNRHMWYPLRNQRAKMSQGLLGHSCTFLSTVQLFL